MLMQIKFWHRQTLRWNFGGEKLLAEDFRGVRWMYEGILLECDDEPRPIVAKEGPRSPAKRKPQAFSAEATALDMVLAGNTGPVNVTLWDDAAHQMLSLLGTRRTAGPQKIIVRLEHVRVANLSKSEWNGTIITSLKVVHSVWATPMSEGTRISLPTMCSSPYLVSAAYRVPASNVAVQQFAPLSSKLQAPFKGTFVGTVTEVGDLETSQQGQGKRYFELVDDHGSWMKCLAIGRNSMHRGLAEGRQVVLYNCSGRPGLGSSEAMLVVRKDGVIVPTGVTKHCVRKWMFIDLGVS